MFTENHAFQDKLWQITINCLVLCAGLTKTRNKKLRPLSDLLKRHEFNGSLKFSKWSTVKKHFFRGNHHYTIFLVISVFILSRLNLEIQTQPETHFDKYDSILPSNSWFDWRLKMSILDNFSLRAWEPNLEFGGSCGKIESATRIIWEVGTQLSFNYQVLKMFSW